MKTYLLQTPEADVAATTDRQTVGQQWQAQHDQQAALRLDVEVRNAARSRGATLEQEGALVARAREVFVIADGQARPMKPDGRTPLRRADGWLVSVEDWVASMLPEKDTARAPVAMPTKNPFRRESWNLTEQMRIGRRDPALAARLREAI